MWKVMTLALTASLACGGLPAAWAQADEEATRREQREQLQDAQRRLAEAAREIAELSAEAYGPALREALGMGSSSSRRALLGINLGAGEAGAAGVPVIGVSPGGPAATAGVAAGDTIVAIDGQAVQTGRDLTRRMRSVEPEQRVVLKLRRDGAERDITVVARAATEVEPGVPPLPGIPDIALPGRHFLLGSWGDAELVTMTPGLGRYFGTDTGVLVLRVPRNAGAGLEEGDVILAIGGRSPESGAHALRILRSYQAGEKIELKLMRERKPRDLVIEVPPRPSARVPSPRPALSAAGGS